MGPNKNSCSQQTRQIQVMILEWGLILSVTSVSVTMLMIVGAFLAVLGQAQQYYQVNRTWLLLLSNSFNIGYIIITPFIFNTFRKYYVNGIIISATATGIAAVGRYLAGDNYQMCLAMTAMVAVAHIPIITAPYGLLKLFPDWQKGYAASIPLFLPTLGINFCILYGIAYIADDGSHTTTVQQTHYQISRLNYIIAIVGVISTAATIILVLLLKDKIQAEDTHQQPVQHEHIKINDKETGSTEVNSVDLSAVKDQPQLKQPANEETNFIRGIKKTFYEYKRTTFIILAWGTIVGINWTYGALFGVIFDNQNLSGKEIALIGLAANLSSAIFSNLGTFIKNRFNLQNLTVIEYLNLAGIAASILIQLSRYVSAFQNLYFLIFVIIVLRAGFSSFVALAFVQMQKQGMSSLIVSGIFFWIANVGNLIGMQLIDLAPTDISLFMLTASVCLCIYAVRSNEAKRQEDRAI